MRLLADLTIVEICRNGTPLPVRLATSVAAKMFAGLGASVIRLEPPGGDPLRAVAPLLPNGESALHHFLSTDMSLLSVGDEREGEGVLESLAAQGLAGAILPDGDASLQLIKNAGISSVRIATWPVGLEDQCHDRPVREFQISALGGMLDMIGDPEREPLRLAGHQMAYSTGASAFSAGMAAIMGREAAGQAVHARVSLLETAAWINWKAVAGAVAGTPVTRRGAKAEFQVLPCRDGWIAFVYTPSQYDRVCVMLDDDQALDERFATRAGRMANIGDFMGLLRHWLAGRTREEVYSAARAHGVPLGPVYEPAELLDDEQYMARRFLASYAAGGEGARMPTLPIAINGTRFALKGPVSVNLADVAGTGL